MSTQCQCESIKCEHHKASSILDAKLCENLGIFPVDTIYGKYHLCYDCAFNLPDAYYKDIKQKPRTK